LLYAVGVDIDLTFVFL